MYENGESFMFESSLVPVFKLIIQPLTAVWVDNKCDERTRVSISSLAALQFAVPFPQFRIKIRFPVPNCKPSKTRMGNFNLCGFSDKYGHFPLLTISDPYDDLLFHLNQHPSCVDRCHCRDRNS
jgi:hypothetical protein